MIASFFRSAGAIVLSVIVAFALIVLIEVVGAILYPLPPGLDPTDHTAIEAHVATCPQWVLALAAAAWAATVFVSVWLATRLGAGRHPAHGIAIGLLLFAAAGFNMYLLPYPIWFDVANCILFPVCTIIAVKFAGKSAVGNTEPPVPAASD